MKLEKEKKVPPSELMQAIKNNSNAIENKYIARRRGVAVGTLAGGAATAGGVAYGINKKES
jgi:homoserine dehydrogenase